MKNLRIFHDIEGHLFYAKVKGGMAKLGYDRFGNTHLDYKWTFVPRDSRNFGIASTMADFALTFAEEQHMKVKPSCPFIQDFISKNPRYKKLALNPESDVQSLSRVQPGEVF